MSLPTVHIQSIEGLPALRMVWQHDVLESDVAAAFEAIMDELNGSVEPLYVVVDLLSNPNFPVMATVQHALNPYRHPQLKEWLIVGSNWMARIIENMLSKITRHKNVRWFASEAEALAYIKSALAAR